MNPGLVAPSAWDDALQGLQDDNRDSQLGALQDYADNGPGDLSTQAQIQAALPPPPPDQAPPAGPPPDESQPPTDLSNPDTQAQVQQAQDMANTVLGAWNQWGDITRQAADQVGPEPQMSPEAERQWRIQSQASADAPP